MKKEVAERTDIDRETKIILLSVLQKGYFEQEDINLLKNKVKPLKNQTTTVFFRSYGKGNVEKEFVNENDE